MEIIKRLLPVILDALEGLAKETDNTIDDAAIALVKELIDKYFSD